ncbi:DUF881 domain-containing protein, partial [Streptomyces sp. NPDC058834]|uniref:DUF881 domain-containing protein n=1 Tax=Streptomyces sp. NPDC058834 TaxID=3346647 RepID=UPI0036CC9D7D
CTAWAPRSAATRSARARGAARRAPGAGGGGWWGGAGVVRGGGPQRAAAGPPDPQERHAHLDRIEGETSTADKLEESVDELREDVSARQREALEKNGDSDRSDLMGVLSGAVEVHGPGVKLVVSDAKDTGTGGDGQPRGTSGFSDTGRVRDRDMQRVVNGLWESGAEAISINGQRLTALSAIRAAGDAILVDNRPLVPPYTVLAVGDGEGLSTRFQDSADGLYLHALQENYGIRTAISVADDLELPAATSVIVRTAQPITEKGTS